MVLRLVKMAMTLTPIVLLVLLSISCTTDSALETTNLQNSESPPLAKESPADSEELNQNKIAPTGKGNRQHTVPSNNSESPKESGTDSNRSPEGKDNSTIPHSGETKIIYFNPEKDGFGFENFSGGKEKSSINIPDLIWLYGEKGLCAAGTGDQCEPYPGVLLFLERLNEVLANGLCYGISASVANHFSAGSEPSGLSKFKQDQDPVSAINRDKDGLEHYIAKLHMMQFSEEYRNELENYIEKSPNQIVEELMKYFNLVNSIPMPPYTLALYSEHGGHSITPIGIEKTDIGYKIKVYDSNWPMESRWVYVDSESDTWTFQASVNPQSQEDLWTGVGPGSMTLIPHHIPQEGSAHCFFCELTGEEIPEGKATGSVIIVNSADISNTVFEISAANEGNMRWTTSGRSGSLEEVKTYILPASSNPKNNNQDVLLVAIPNEVKDFRVNLAIKEPSESENKFGLLFAGQGLPTTITEGNLSLEVEDDTSSENILTVSRDDDAKKIDLVVDSKAVETIKSASRKSIVFVQPKAEERFESEISEGLITDIRIVEKETSKTIHSLKSVLQAIDTPLRNTESGDGLEFSKYADGSIKLQSSDNDVINKSVLSEYDVKFADGTSALFKHDDTGNMVGTFSDGATSIRFESGSAVHATEDGWIINESIDGKLQVLRELPNGVIRTPEKQDIKEMMPVALEAKSAFEELLITRVTRKEDTVQILEKTPIIGKDLTDISRKYEIMKTVREKLTVDGEEPQTLKSLLGDTLTIIRSESKAKSLDETEPKEQKKGIPDPSEKTKEKRLLEDTALKDLPITIQVPDSTQVPSSNGSSNMGDMKDQETLKRKGQELLKKMDEQIQKPAKTEEREKPVKGEKAVERQDSEKAEKAVERQDSEKAEKAVERQDSEKAEKAVERQDSEKAEKAVERQKPERKQSKERSSKSSRSSSSW